MGIREELLALKAEHGPLLKVEVVLAWAEAHSDSALHGELTWDNAHAAHLYRLDQIRNLIQIHVKNQEGHRQLISLSIDRGHEGGGYRDRDAVLAAPDLRKVLLNDAIGELVHLRTKYAYFKELGDVWRAIDKAAHRYRGGGDRAKSAPRSPARGSAPGPAPS